MSFLACPLLMVYYSKGTFITSASGECCWCGRTSGPDKFSVTVYMLNWVGIPSMGSWDNGCFVDGKLSATEQYLLYPVTMTDFRWHNPLHVAAQPKCLPTHQVRRTLVRVAVSATGRRSTVAAVAAFPVIMVERALKVCGIGINWIYCTENTKNGWL